jgi:serine/threonine protein phosphatase PrpC
VSDPLVVGLFLIAAFAAAAWFLWGKETPQPPPERKKKPRPPVEPFPEPSITEKRSEPAAATANALEVRIPENRLPSLVDDEEYEDAGDVTAMATAARFMGASVRDAIPIVYDDDATDETTRSSAIIEICAAALSDRGLHRKRNEDSYVVLDEVVAIADGMGAHARGDIASKLAVDALTEAFRSNSVTLHPSRPDLPARGSELVTAIQAANTAVHRLAASKPELEGMGTTMVSARFSARKQRLYIGNVGDSRCYRLRGGTLSQMTRDHTLAAEVGVVSNQAPLTRALGVLPNVSVDLIVAKPMPGDVYLLCSDGLTRMATDEEIRQIMMNEPDLEACVRALVARANAAGGHDNTTVLVVRVQARKRRPRAMPEAHPN